MIVVIDLEGLLVPFGQGFRYIILIQDFFKEGDLNRLLELIKGSGRVFSNSGVSKEDLEFRNMVLD